MIPDIERKILTIIYHYTNKNKKTPSYATLSRFTGRNEEDIRKIVLKLKEEGRIKKNY